MVSRKERKEHMKYEERRHELHKKVCKYINEKKVIGLIKSWLPAVANLLPYKKRKEHPVLVLGYELQVSPKTWKEIVLPGLKQIQQEYSEHYVMKGRITKFGAIVRWYPVEKG